MATLRVVCIGDVVGETGRSMFQKHVPRLKKELNIDAVLVNGENSGPNGRGITPRIVHFFKHNGADVVTTGNHIWAQKEIYPYLANNTDLLRPANFPSGCPGVGVTTFACRGYTVGVINVQGRIFMREHVDCPFRTADSILSYLRSKTNIIIVDMHAEASSEKKSLAFFLDGKVSAVVGTHTHVQTADEQILPGGTGYITDLGMAGSLYSSLGMKKDAIIHNFLTQMPAKFMVETTPPIIMTGVIIDIDTSSGKTVAIERVKVIDNELIVESTKDEHHKE